jgi:hypothetical protein
MNREMPIEHWMDGDDENRIVLECRSRLVRVLSVGLVAIS